MRFKYRILQEGTMYRLQWRRLGLCWWPFWHTEGESYVELQDARRSLEWYKTKPHPGRTERKVVYVDNPHLGEAHR